VLMRSFGTFREPAALVEYTKECDVLVVGSGAGGMSAAISAKLHGVKPLIVEKCAQFGGSTARSGGMIWVPCNHLSKAQGVKDSIDNALLYIEHEAGPFFDRARSESYLRTAPDMIRTYEQQTSAMRFVRNDSVADNHPHLPGSVDSGRTLTVPPFDGRLLGGDLQSLSPPLRELTFFGMQIQPDRDLNHFFGALNSWNSFRYVAKRLTRHAIDLISNRRTMQLANGNALAARLARSAFDLGIDLWLSSPTIQLLYDQRRVTGAIVERAGQKVRINARFGIVLACGGFPHDAARRAQMCNIGSAGSGQFALAPAGDSGDGLRLAEDVGGRVEDGFPNPISWTPVSRVPRKRGNAGLFPHGFDRNKPGIIAVTRHGKRFINESVIGNDFIRAMLRECRDEPFEGFLIADHHTVRRYGIGIVRPSPMPLRSHLRSGYLLSGGTIAELAMQAGISSDTLERTVEGFNRSACAGVDSEFNRGQTAFELRNGDPKVTPNPCLAPIINPPFYAIRILPGDFSTLAGLRTDENARVLDSLSRPIPGLYAVGNDAASLFGGNSAAGGSTLGPALTFGFIAGKFIAETNERNIAVGNAT